MSNYINLCYNKINIEKSFVLTFPIDQNLGGGIKLIFILILNRIQF